MHIYLSPRWLLSLFSLLDYGHRSLIGLLCLPPAIYSQNSSQGDPVILKSDQVIFLLRIPTSFGVKVTVFTLTFTGWPYVLVHFEPRALGVCSVFLFCFFDIHLLALPFVPGFSFFIKLSHWNLY